MLAVDLIQDEASVPVKGPGEPAQDVEVLVLLEVAEAAEPVADPMERVHEIKVSEIHDLEESLHSLTAKPCARPPDESRLEVHPRDVGAAPGQVDRDPPGAARGVQDAVSLLQPEGLEDEGGVAQALVVGQEPEPGVQGLKPRLHFSPRPAGFRSIQIM